MFSPLSMQGGNKHDVESLEQENDQSLDALGDRVGMLKKVTLLAGLQRDFIFGKKKPGIMASFAFRGQQSKGTMLHAAITHKDMTLAQSAMMCHMAANDLGFLGIHLGCMRCPS